MQLACRVLEVSESGFYDWQSRPLSARAIRDVWLIDQIRAVHAASRGIYGVRRMHAELVLGRGIMFGHGAVEILMRRARRGHRAAEVALPRPDQIATDLLNRNFTAEAPNASGSPTSLSTTPARASCTARSCSTHTHGAS